MPELNALKYLEKRELLEELDYSNIKYLLLTTKYEGYICKVCGIIQGKPNKGFQRYFCKHITKLIDNKMKKENKKIIEKITRWSIPLNAQTNP